MAKFTRGQSITFKCGGKILTGKVEYVGTDIWGVRMADRKYYAVYERDLVGQTPATKLGLQYGDIVVVGRGIKCPHSFTVGEEATFERDDHSDSPLFKQDGNTQYLDLSEITIGRKQVVDNRTPAEKMGLAVGDEVSVTNALRRNLRGRIFFHRDDGTRIPRFRDEFGNQHYVHLEDVTKAPQGPKAGVLWSEAPAGATHYSLESLHRAKWHKLDEAGQWFYHEDGRFNIYYETRYAYPASQVAIPGVVVEVNPLNTVLDEVKALEARVREKLTAAEQLNREVAQLTAEKADKLAEIKAAGFKVVDGELVKSGPSKDEWQSGDRVRCVKREGRGLANIIVGGIYRVKVAHGVICVVDGDGDAMRGCVERDCFEFVERSPRLQDIPATEWKAGDTVEALKDSLDITKGSRYVLTGMCDIAGMRVRFRDDVNIPRRRAASEYKLVARK